MHRYDRPRQLLAFGIAGLAGFVDAAGFLAADGYFVSFMSGNTTRLGVDLATRTVTALTPALLIAAFVGGVTLGAIAAESALARRKSAVLGLSAAFLCIAAIGHLLGQTSLFLGGLVFAMGVVNNTFRRDGEVAVGVTYMTGALVRFGQGLAARLMARKLEGASASLLLWASLASGAVAGAVVTRSAPAIAPWLPVVAACGLAIAARRLERLA
jgi:uncharacterized membrane protein YoaK (UPF0700 family)